MEKEERPLLIYQKNAEPLSHKMIIPKAFFDKYGIQYYMEVYEDKLVIRPLKKKEKQED